MVQLPQGLPRVSLSAPVGCRQYPLCHSSGRLHRRYHRRFQGLKAEVSGKPLPSGQASRSVGGRGNHGFPQPWGLPVDLMWILVWMPTEACPTRGLNPAHQAMQKGLGPGSRHQGAVHRGDRGQQGGGAQFASSLSWPTTSSLPTMAILPGSSTPPFQHGAVAGKGGAATPSSRPRPMHQVRCTNGFDADLSQTDPDELGVADILMPAVVAGLPAVSPPAGQSVRQAEWPGSMVSSRILPLGSSEGSPSTSGSPGRQLLHQLRGVHGPSFTGMASPPRPAMSNPSRPRCSSGSPAA